MSGLTEGFLSYVGPKDTGWEAKGKCIGEFVCRIMGVSKTEGTFETFLKRCG